MTWRTQTWHNIDWSKQFGIAMRRKPGIGLWPEGSRAKIPWGPPWLVPKGPPSAVIAGTTPIDRIAEWIVRNDCRYFSGLPITLAALTEEPDAARMRLEKCLSYGMRVKSEQRQAVKNVFGAPIIELYGSEECGPMAHACEAGSLHVMSELLRLEIVDEDGLPCPPGTTGKVLLTVFHNAAQPIIRYAIGDVAAFGGPCSCGRAHPVITGIPGRHRDLFRRPDGSRFVAHTIDGLFPAHAGVKWWQIAQIESNAVELRIVAAAPFGAADLDRVTQIFREAWNWQCRVDFRQLEILPYGPGAKHVDFVNECVAQ